MKATDACVGLEYKKAILAVAKDLAKKKATSRSVSVLDFLHLFISLFIISETCECQAVWGWKVLV